MATFILVHGGKVSTDTWNRLSTRNRYPPGGLLGAKIWDDTAVFLREHGHRVYAPDLADEHTHNLTDHIGQVCSLIEKQDLRNVILAGHSYGGMVITGVADRIPARIRRLVYIDAALPDPGQSLFDLFIAVGFDPLSFTGLEAAKAYVEKLQFDSRRSVPSREPTSAAQRATSPASLQVQWRRSPGIQRDGPVVSCQPRTCRWRRFHGG
jgi:pimeloyl-ACP methyl ester carboxylesterase